MRPIDADALVDKLGASDRDIYVKACLEEDAPTIDAVPVVRCRDCRYWRQEVDAHTHWVCTQHSYNERLMHTTPDFYCADGKRGDDNA